MVFIGAIGGASAFGMLGLIIGPVLLSVIAAIVRYIETERVKISQTLPEPAPIALSQRTLSE